MAITQAGRKSAFAKYLRASFCDVCRGIGLAVGMGINRDFGYLLSRGY
ncbi:hypothetical protein [Thalassospira sp.]